MKSVSGIFSSSSPYKPFLISLALNAVGFGLFKGVSDNYMAEVVHMMEFDRGLTEFFRELPGLLLIVILAVFRSASAERMYSWGMMIMTIGMACLVFVPPFKWPVILTIFFYSIGEHIQLGMRNTLSLEYAKTGSGGSALGIQNAMYQIGNLTGFVIVIAAFWLIPGTKLFTPTFLTATACFLLGTLCCVRLKSRSKGDPTKSRFYFRKKFKKYYLLEVFYGARKQVFFTFGPYVLILFYKADTSTISLLFAISAALCFLISPLVGRLIDRIGYKIVMIMDTILLFFVCFFYGFAHHLFSMEVAFIICCVNYVLDSIISLASMASNVYVQDISKDNQEMRATISTGISVNHMITIFIALLGGWIWKVLGIETLFILSAFLGLCNSAYAATIKKTD